MTGKFTQENTEEGDESYFVRCSCYGHLLNLAVFKDELNDPQGILYVSSYDQDSRFSWGMRFREAWKLIRTGEGGGREILLRPTEAWELGQKMVELAGKMMRGKKDDG